MRVYSLTGLIEGGHALAGKLVFPEADAEQAEYERRRERSDGGTGKRYRAVLGRGRRRKSDCETSPGTAA